MKVDRGSTPWLFVIFHEPWYNSNHAHQKENTALEMKVGSPTPETLNPKP